MAERDRAAVDVDPLGVDLERRGSVATATPANASLISHRSMSAAVRPWRASRRCAASAGRRCSVESGPGDDRAADDLGERLEARGAGASAVVTTPAAPPSETCEALPAVIVPSLAEGGRGARPRPSAVVVGRMPSSRSSSSSGAISSAAAPPRWRRPRGRASCAAKRVLRLARDVEARVLGVGQLAHPGVCDRAVQAVVDHHVDHRLVAHRAGGRRPDSVRRAGHRVEAADQRRGRLALADHARRQRRPR